MQEVALPEHALIGAQCNNLDVVELVEVFFAPPAFRAFSPAVFLVIVADVGTDMFWCLTQAMPDGSLYAVRQQRSPAYRLHQKYSFARLSTDGAVVISRQSDQVVEDVSFT